GRGPFLGGVEGADAALVAAERANERQQRLSKEGIVAKKDVDQAAADLARARSESVTAHHALKLSILRAAITGTVTKMTATVGVGVDPTQQLVAIPERWGLEVLRSVTPSDAARVRPSAKVALTAGQSTNGEPLGVGTVTDVSATIDTTTRSVPVRVRVPSTRRPLRIGETVFGAITVGVRPSAIVVPSEALVPEGDAFKVFVVDAGGLAHAREVQIGGRSDAGVEITAGLRAGERIVTIGAYGVQDSAKVVPFVPADSAKPEKL